MGKVIIHIGLGSILALLGSCASKAGDIHATVQMRSNVQLVLPSAPVEAPPGFPSIPLIWEATAKASSQGIAAQPQPTARRGLMHPESPPLPARSAYLSSDAQRFVTAAEKIVTSIFKGESTDPAIALSLLEQVAEESSLEELRHQWAPILRKAVAFAQFHQPIAGPLKRLRKAFAEARFDEDYGIYRKIDVVSCREAADRIQETLGDSSRRLQIPPIGTQPIKHFRTLCEQSLMVELSERAFPETKGSSYLRRAVKRAYESDYPEASVRKIHLILPWSTTDSSRSMKAVLGIQRQDTYPEHPCTMETLIILQEKHKNKWEQPQCTAMVETLPIDCEQLR